MQNRITDALAIILLLHGLVLLASCATPEPPEPGDTTSMPWGYYDMIMRNPDSVFAPGGELP